MNPRYDFPNVQIELVFFMAQAKYERKEVILRYTANFASLYGLNDLTIGKLAEQMNMSKAGLHGIFGSKMKLQLETIKYAGKIFAQEVIFPVRSLDGQEKISGFCNNWLSYIDKKVFDGGCFFARITMEGAALPDEVTQAVLKKFSLFRNILTSEIKKSPSSQDAEQRSDQLLALIVSYNWTVHSLKSSTAAASIKQLLLTLLH
ncbi:MAG: TetR/AcrR family transcriptional regulator [Spirochaetota bacterium]